MKRTRSCASGTGDVAEDSSRKRHKSNNTEETSSKIDVADEVNM